MIDLQTWQCQPLFSTIFVKSIAVVVGLLFQNMKAAVMQHKLITWDLVWLLLRVPHHRSSSPLDASHTAVHVLSRSSTPKFIHLQHTGTYNLTINAGPMARSMFKVWSKITNWCSCVFWVWYAAKVWWRSVDAWSRYACALGSATSSSRSTCGF